MSRLARLSLANRSVVALVTVAIAVFGWFSLGSLKQELIPSLQIPTAVVVAVDPGSSPDLVEQQLTEPIEQALSSVDDVESVTSTSATSVSTTTVQLTYGVDVDARAQEIQRAVDRIRSSLPDGVEPSVFTGSIDDLPVVQLAVAGTPDDVREGEDPQAALARVVQDVVAPRLEQVPGVRDVAVTGVAEQAVTITLDLPALTAVGLSPTAVQTVLQDNGVVLPTGTVDDGDRTLSVQAGSPITSVDDLRALPLLGAAGPVTLGDVADVVVAPVPATSFSRLDGEPALAVALTKTPAGNTVDVSHGAQQAVDDLRAQLGDGVDVAVVFDQAPFIEESIEGLATEGGLGLLFAVVVILLFLASLRSTLVSAVSIPLSLLVTFIGLRLTGYSLNILTLGAMTIAIGRVVDDSIVVIENIKRHLSYGEPKRDAIVTAVREVAAAITASTVATIAVFLPIGLVGGMVGELFRPFAFTTAIALAASLLVSLTIVPVLAYWFVRADAADPAQAERVRAEAEAKERRSWMQRGYLATLRGALAHPVVTIVAALVVFGGTLGLATRLETNFLGDAGQDTLTVTQTFPPATSLEAQDAAARVVEDALADVDGVETVQTTVGSAGGIEAAFSGGGALRATFALTLDAGSDNAAVTDDVRAAVADLPDGTPGDVVVAGADAAFGSSTVDVVVQSDDPDELAGLADRVRDVVAGVEGTTDVTNDLAADQPTVQVTVDRAAAAAAGLTETQVVGTVAGLMSPQPVGTVDLGAGPLDVTVVTLPAPASVAELEQLVLPTPTGVVPLTAVASVAQVEVPVSTTRIDGERAATVSATPADQDLGALTQRLTAALEDVDVPAGASVEVGGVAADQADAFSDLGLALLIAIAIVYVVMVATFRSLLQPVILMVSVPFAATGALVGLLVTGTPLGVPALIGVLMLIGVVVTNAIVLVDLVNQYRERGRDLDEAVTEGARKRLRPIVMTAAATIFALVPMALGLTGGGVFISRPLAIVVIGGLFTSTLLTLVLVPVLYTLVERARLRAGARRAARREARAGAEGTHGAHAA
ncbi:efflux RND transporter permease subunit [Cellulomonas sp. HD19AZ1]|uniref:efflux RND transporter permease subunit n=1 Tax=Cellulomonas sp. HD19AZ1 TaxID=2559593 RepID=UPI001070A69D|nr:efflux RND transporter permease subunit [Cellulomonas sp. HD19AZ1]TFH70520.1 efflux RND transporter permease subunit [Cellulomonas sp. HD19AZ1]